MTADNCIYWQGEGCICEIETGIRCGGMTKSFIPQCKYTNEDLEAIEDETEEE